MWKACQNSKTRYCQPNQRMFWNMTKPGVLCSKRSISAGCGLSCVVEPDKSSHLWSVIAVKIPVVAFGTRFQASIAIVFPTVISGRLIKKCSRRKHIMRLVKIAGRYLTWNVGTVLCANIRLAMFARPFRFQSVTPFITWLPTGSSLTTIWLGNNSYHLLCDHYPNNQPASIFKNAKLLYNNLWSFSRTLNVNFSNSNPCH